MMGLLDKTPKKFGITLEEKRALVLGRNQAAAQLKREMLFLKERIQSKKLNTKEDIFFKGK